MNFQLPKFENLPSENQITCSNCKQPNPMHMSNCTHCRHPLPFTSSSAAQKLPSGVIIGSHSDSDLRLAVKGVSSIHAFLWVKNNTIWIRDLAGKNKTFVDGVPIDRDSVQITPESRIELGPALITSDDLFSALRSSHRCAFVGRSLDNDLVIDLPGISRVHMAILQRYNESYEIIDLQSTNGITISSNDPNNSVRVDKRILVSRHCNIQIGVHTFDLRDLTKIFDLNQIPLRTFVHLDRPILIGHSPECDLILSSEKVGDINVRLHPQPHGCVILQDLGCPVGVFVDGERVNHKSTILRRTVVTIGTTRIIIDPMQQFASVFTTPEEIDRKIKYLRQSSVNLKKTQKQNASPNSEQDSPNAPQSSQLYPSNLLHLDSAEAAKTSIIDTEHQLSPRPQHDPSNSEQTSIDRINQQLDFPASSLGQFQFLLNRTNQAKTTNRIEITITAIQAPLWAIIILSLIENAKSGLPHRGKILIFTGLVSIFIGIYNACLALVRERFVYERERKLGLRIVPYLLSKYIPITILGLIQMAILYYIIDFCADLSGSSEHYLLMFASIIFASTALGLFVSAMARSSWTAVGLATIVFFPQISLNLLESTSVNQNHAWSNYLTAPLVSHWTSEGLLEVERIGLTENIVATEVPSTPGIDSGALSHSSENGTQGGDNENPQAEKSDISFVQNKDDWQSLEMLSRNLTPGRLFEDIIVLNVFAALFLIFAVITLHRRESKTH